MKKYLVMCSAIGLLVFGAMGCGDDSPNVEAPNTESQGYIDDIEGYSSWFLFGEDTEPVASSPHGGDFILTYGNTPAQDTIEAESYPFPEGTLIVKEQYSNPDDSEPVTLSIMAKRSDDEGDWYWLQTDMNEMVRIQGGEAVQGADVEMCASCHGAGSNDMVYVDLYSWAE